MISQENIERVQGTKFYWLFAEIITVLDSLEKRVIELEGEVQRLENEKAGKRGPKPKEAQQGSQ